MNDKDDTDSEWDSTLDFTSPRQENKVSRPPEIEDEDASRHDSIMDKPKPKERTTVPVSQYLTMRSLWFTHVYRLFKSEIQSINILYNSENIEHKKDLFFFRIYFDILSYQAQL